MFMSNTRWDNERFIVIVAITLTINMNFDSF